MSKGLTILLSVSIFFLFFAAAIFLNGASLTGNVIESSEIENSSLSNETLDEGESSANESNLPINESNFPANESEPETNISIGNETQEQSNVSEEKIPDADETSAVNVTVNVTQYDAVLGKPVRWTKKIDSSHVVDVEVRLPEVAEDISVLETESGSSEENLDIKTFVSTEQDYSIDLEINGQEVDGSVEVHLEENSEVFFTGSFDTAIVEESSSNFLFNFLTALRSVISITGHVISDQADVVNIEDVKSVEIEYYTEAPYAIETETETSKEILIVGPEDVHYQNVLAFTELPESFNIQNSNGFRIYWQEENTFVDYIASDTDANGIYDYVEWTVPHLSNQTFIIEITNAQHLDSNRTFVSDIFSDVRYLDGNWSEEIPDTHYVRITFERNLTNVNDITVYPRTISGEPRIDIYESGSEEVIASFDSLVDNQYNRVILSGLVDSRDTFDLQILGGSVEFDHIIDPVPTESNAPSIIFTSPTPSNASTVVGTNAIFVNVSSVDDSEHYTFVDFDRDLLLWYRMDDLNGDGTGLSDLSTYNWTSNLQGVGSNISINSSGGYWANGSMFNGQRAGLTISDDDRFNIYSGTNFTFSVWINPANFSAAGVLKQIMGKGTKYALSYTYSGAGDGHLRLNIQNQTSSTFTFYSPTVAKGAWSHLVLTRTGGEGEVGNYTFYINGVIVNSTLFGGSLNNTGSFSLFSDSAFANSWNGSMDEVIVFKRTLDINEVRALYNASTNKYYRNFTHLTYWNHNFTGHAVDVSGNRNRTENRIATLILENVSPLVTINTPQNITYTTQLSANITLNENGTCLYSVNGGSTNISLTAINNSMFVDPITTISSGNSYVFRAYCNDSWGNRNDTTNVHFTFNDTTSPLVTINTPQNITYTTEIFNFNITLNENGSVRYSLNNGATNYSMSPLFGFNFNATNSTLRNGNYILRIYANDTVGNRNDTESVSFSVVLPQCGDYIDNDGDGYKDMFDYSCRIGGANETTYIAQCQDGVDNDADGFVDYPSDPNCRSNQDKREYNKSNLGMNVLPVSWFSTVLPFTDLFEHASADSNYSVYWSFSLSGGGQNSAAALNTTLDSYGYPLSVPVYYEGSPYRLSRTVAYSLNGSYPGGVYTFSADGTGTIELSNDVDTTNYNFPGGPYNVTVSPGDYGIEFTILNSSSSDHIRNIKFLTPGYASHGSPYNPDFMTRLQNFTFLRWMEVTRTNAASNASANWSTRATPGQSQSTDRGVAMEHLINVSNLLYVDIWINIPHQADDEYLRNLSRLLNQTLNPDLKVYVEYSNELWNFAFTQTRYMQFMGCQDPTLGVCTDAGTNFSIGGKYHAKRSAQIFDIFQQEMGNSTSRLVKVFAWQSAYGDGVSGAGSMMSYYRNSTINPTNITPDAVAIAPYFGDTTGDYVNDTGIGDNATAVQQHLLIGVQNVTRATQKYKNFTDYYNVTLLAYEGGTHVAVFGNLTLNETLIGQLIAAQRDQGMYEVMHTGYDAWVQNGGQGFAHFGFIAEPGPAGFWGVLEYQNQSPNEAPKYRFYNNYLNNWYNRVAPNVSIVYPLNTTYATNVTTFNFSAYDLNLAANCSYSLNNGATNVTVGCSATSVTGIGAGLGSNRWTFYAVDTAGNINATQISFVYSANEISAPNINFTHPTPNNASTVNAPSIFVNLSTQDSSTHYSFVDFDSSLVFWMPFDDVNATGSPIDLSRFGNNGTIVNGTIINSTAVFGSASIFNGTNYITIPHGEQYNFGNERRFTLAFWFMLYGNGSNQYIFDRTNGVGFACQYQVSVARILCAIDGNGTDASAVSNSNSITSTNTWYHIVLVANNSNAFVYVNGVTPGSTSIAAVGNMSVSNLGIILGAGGSSGTITSFLNGSIDDVLIFNRTLNASEIRSLYNASANQYFNNFTDLSDTAHTFRGYTIDSFGNRNQTDLRTVSTNAPGSPPMVTIVLPQNTSYGAGNLPSTFNVTLSELGSLVQFSLDNGATNYTMTSTNGLNYGAVRPVITPGQYIFRVYANDTAGDRNDSISSTFIYDTTAPVVEMSAPTSAGLGIISTNNVTFNISLSEIGSCQYSLDGGITNTTINSTNNVTFYGNVSYLSNNLYRINFYCNDTANNRNDTSFINFRVNQLASRTSCTAPCGVVFDVAGLNFSGTDRPFHNLLYHWDFGDSGSRHPTARGAIAAHVFENNGTFNVSLSVNGSSGNIYRTSQLINVADPNVTFSGTNTICFSTSGTFTGCPGGATQVTTANVSNISSYVGTGKRLLLARGESWNSNISGFTIDTDGPGMIGAYGTCSGQDPRGICSNNPELNISGASGFNFVTSGDNHYSNWVISDLTLKGNATSGHRGVVLNADFDHVLFLHMNTYNLHGGHTDNGHSRQVFVVDSWYHDYGGGGGANNLYIGGKQLAIIGNNITNSTGIEHVLRVHYAENSVVSDNIIAYPNSDKHALKFHTDDTNPNKFNIISGNEFRGGLADWNVALGPQNAVANESQTDIIVERNKFFTDSSSQILLLVWVPNVTIRNNVFVGGGGVTAIQLDVREPNPGYSRPFTSNISVYNNLAYMENSSYTRGATTNFVFLAVTNASNVSVHNNLVYAPNESASTSKFITISADVNRTYGLVTVGSNNNLFKVSSNPALFASVGTVGAATYNLTQWRIYSGKDNQSIEAIPLLANPNNGNFNYSSGSPGIDNGTLVAVFDDFVGNIRPFIGNGTFDIGSFEFVAVQNDTIVPSVTLNNPSNGGYSVSNITYFNATHTDNLQLRNTTLNIWNSTGSLILTNFTNITGTTNNTNLSVVLPYNGVFTWSYKTFNNLSNSASSSNYTLNFDSVAPVVTINSPSNTTYEPSSFSFNVSLNENGTVRFTLNGGATNYTMTTLDNQNFNYTLEVSDGSYTFQVYANDTAGNVNNSASIGFSIVTATAQSGTSGSGGSGGGGSGGDASVIDSIPEETTTPESSEEPSGSGSTFSWESTVNIPKNAFDSSYSFVFSPRTRITFDFANETHYIGVLRINPSEVDLEIASTPRRYSLALGEIIKVDLNEDELSDIDVRLESVEGTTAKIVINYSSLGEKPTFRLTDLVKQFLQKYILQAILASLILLVLVIIMIILHVHHTSRHIKSARMHHHLK